MTNATAAQPSADPGHPGGFAEPAASGRPGRRRRDRAWPWLAPTLVLIALIFVYPIVQVIRLSLTDASLVGPSNYTTSSYHTLWNGLGHVVGVTAIFVALSVVFQMLLGFLIALMLDEAGRRKLWGTGVVRTLVMVAWAIPGVVIGIIWKLLYQPTDAGILNHLSTYLGFSGNIGFLSDPHEAVASITLANIWRGTALSMILCFAGLRTISRDVIEAAHMDGAGALRTLREMIIPLMRPVLVVNFIIVTVETLNTFDMVQALTGGGPGVSTQVLALSIYNEVFNNQSLGVGSAYAVVLMLLNVVIVFGYLAILKRRGLTE